MSSANIKQRINIALLGITLLLGITAAPTASAQSRDGYYGGQQDRNRDRDRDRDRDDRNDRNRRGRDWNRYGRYGGSYELRQTALNAGYNEGIKEGRKDRSKGRRFSFYDKNEYQKATKDYSSRLGDRELYRRYFRDGFENGYTDGFRSY